MKSLRRRKIEFIQISQNEQLPPGSTIWLGTPEEVASSPVGRGIGCNLSDFEVCLDRAIHLAHEHHPTRLLAFGIDPGPRPGLAWDSDGRPMGSEQMENVDDTVDRICQLVDSIPHAIAIVRIGDGSPIIGGRLANICLARGLRVEMVDERRTSMGVGRHEHHAAAARIAKISGMVVTSKRKVKPSTGEVREVQRRSRRESGGRFTLPLELAQAVAVGRLTMGEAFEEYDRRRGTLI